MAWETIVDPRDSQHIYILAPHDLYRSRDRLQTHETLIDFPSSIDLTALVMAPSDPQTLYVAASNIVSRTVDGGITWEPHIIEALPQAPYDEIGVIHTLMVDPLTPSTVYAVTQKYGIHKSVDGGASWVSLPPIPNNTDIYQLAIDPSRPTLLYVSTPQGVYTLHQTTSMIHFPFLIHQP